MRRQGPRPRKPGVRRAFRQRLRRDITKKPAHPHIVSPVYLRLVRDRASLLEQRLREDILRDPPLKQIVRLGHFKPSPRTKGASDRGSTRTTLRRNYLSLNK